MPVLSSILPCCIGWDAVFCLWHKAALQRAPAGTPREFGGALEPEPCAYSITHTPAPGTPTQARPHLPVAVIHTRTKDCQGSIRDHANVAGALTPLRHAKLIVRKRVTALLSWALDDHVLEAVKYDESHMIGWLRQEFDYLPAVDRKTELESALTRRYACAGARVTGCGRRQGRL